jgi:hypothetical protein
MGWQNRTEGSRSGRESGTHPLPIWFPPAQNELVRISRTRKVLVGRSYSVAHPGWPMGGSRLNDVFAGVRGRDIPLMMMGLFSV